MEIKVEDFGKGGFATAFAWAYFEAKDGEWPCDCHASQIHYCGLDD